MLIFYATVVLVVWHSVSTSALCQLNSTQSHDDPIENSSVLIATQSCAKKSNVIENKVTKNEIRDYLKYSSFVYGLLVSIKKEDVSNTCYVQANKVIEGIKVKESWAMKGK
jgi:hypothetical protein